MIVGQPGGTSARNISWKGERSHFLGVRIGAPGGSVRKRRISSLSAVISTTRGASSRHSGAEPWTVSRSPTLAFHISCGCNPAPRPRAVAR